MTTRKLLLLVAILCLSHSSNLLAQGVGVNEDNSSPHATAILDVKSTTKGMLVPRMTTVQRTAIAGAATGLLVYDDTTDSFWYFDGTQWTELINSNTALGDDLGNHTATQNLETDNNWISNDGGNEGLYVNAAGAVGVGTNNPVEVLDVAGDIYVQGDDVYFSNDNATNTNNDYFSYEDDNNLAAPFGSLGIMHFHADAARGQAWNAPSASISAQGAYFTGRVGIGATAPAEVLDVAGDVYIQGDDIYYSHDNATNTNNDYSSYDDVNSLAFGGAGMFHFHADGARGRAWNAPSASISADGAYFIGRVGIHTQNPTYALTLPNNTATTVGRGLANAWTTYSDSRIKTNRKSLEYGVSTVLALNPLAYHHHSSTLDAESGITVEDEYSEEIGFIAQELYEIVPEAVQRPANEKTDYWTVDYTRLIPVLVKAVQEQQQTIEQQEATINALLEAQDARIKALEEKLNK